MRKQLQQLQRRVDELDVMLTATVVHPEWFNADVLPAAQDWVEGEIAAVEAEQLELIKRGEENENSRLGGRLIFRGETLVLSSVY